MAALAMRLLALGLHRGVSSALIYQACHWFEMSGIHTSPVAAEMVNLQPIGDLPDKQFVSEPMGHFC